MGCCFGTTNSQDRTTSNPNRVPPPDEPSSFQVLGGDANKKRENPSNAYVLKESIRQNRKTSSFVVDKDFEAKNEQRNKELSVMHKTKGNDFFKNKQYKPAIQEYSMAIDLYAKDPTYYTNRALCFKFLAKYNDVINDAELSLQLSIQNYKAYHLKGVALVELGKSETTTRKVKEGLENLTKALSLLQGAADREAKETLQLKVGRAKKVIWLKEKEHAENKSVETATFAKNLIAKDTSHSNAEKSEMEALLNTFVTENKKKYTQELPEQICCKITFELIKVPAISSSGITYEKETLLEHLAKVGRFDPFTRQPLQASDLIKNQNIERATLSFQEKNPWSFEDSDEDYRKIQF